MTTHPNLNRLIALSQLWTVSEALWVLQAYQCGSDEFCLGSLWTTANALEGAVERNPSTDLFAADARVKFFGGPNGNREFNASLSTFAMDRALWRWSMQSVDWIWLLRFNPDSDTHLSVQLGKHRPYNASQKFLPGFEDERAGHYEEYAEGERVLEYVQIGNDIVPILESGRQGCADDGKVRRWSSSCQSGVCGETC